MPISMTLRVFTRHLFIAMAVLGLGAGAAGAKTLSPDELLDAAQHAASRGQWVRTAEFLFAYTQTGSPQLQDPAFRTAIGRALRDAEDNARIDAAPAVAGTGGKSDDMGGRGGGRAKPVRIPQPRRSTRVPARRGTGAETGGARQPPSYRLICRGGGDMYADYHPLGRSQELRITFKRARQAVRDRRPGFGECAWLDRPVSAGEPATLRLVVEGRRSGIHTVRLAFAGKGAPYPRANIEKVQGASFDRLLVPIARAFLFQVECYNDGESLRITKVLGKERIP